MLVQADPFFIKESGTQSFPYVDLWMAELPSRANSSEYYLPSENNDNIGKGRELMLNQNSRAFSMLPSMDFQNLEEDFQEEKPANSAASKPAEAVDSASGKVADVSPRRTRGTPITTGGAAGSGQYASRTGQDVVPPVTTGLMSSAFKPSLPAPARMVNLSELTSSPSQPSADSAGASLKSPARNLRRRPPGQSYAAFATSTGSEHQDGSFSTGGDIGDTVSEEEAPVRKKVKRGKRKPDPVLDAISDIEERRKQRRLAKNRATAAVSRDRKRKLMASLEERVKALEKERETLASEVRQRDAEIARLKGGSSGANAAAPVSGPFDSNVNWNNLSGSGAVGGPARFPENGIKSLPADSDGDSHNGGYDSDSLLEL